MTSAPWPVREEVQDHWRWRPEWEPERACLYWYLTFDKDELARTLDPQGLAAVRRAEWLDAVPVRWMHITLCDLGFADELDPSAVREALDAGRAAVVETGHLELSFGAARATNSAVVLPVEPLRRLRRLQERLRSVTEKALGPDHELVHRGVFWPHLSLGYGNRRASAREVATLLEQVGEPAEPVSVDRLVLAKVTRKHRHYQWDVVAELALVRGRRVAVQ